MGMAGATAAEVAALSVAPSVLRVRVGSVVERGKTSVGAAFPVRWYTSVGSVGRIYAVEPPSS